MKTSGVKKEKKEEPAKGGKKVVVCIIKGNHDVIGVDIKIQRARVFVKFVTKASGGAYFEGDNCFIAEIPCFESEDYRWVAENVPKYVDVDNATNEVQAEERAEKMIAKLREKDPEGQKKVGATYLMHEMGKMYMLVDSWVIG